MLRQLLSKNHTENLQLPKSFACLHSCINWRPDLTRTIHIMKTLPFLAAALPLGPPVSAAKKETKDNKDASESFTRKTFNVAPGGNPPIRADRGAIDVKTASTDKVEIEVTREPG